MQTAIITGGSRGIGEAMAMKLGEMGYNVVINYRSDSSKALAEAVIAKLKENYGVEGVAVQADVSKYEDCKKLVEAAVSAFGEKIDVLVNNAGVTNNAAFCNLPREKYMAVLETNLISAFHMCHFVVPYMVKAGSGCVISTSSIGGLHMAPMFGAYGPSKAGVIAITQTAAVENAKAGIRVNAICPGPTEGTNLMADSVAAGNHDTEFLKEHIIPMGKLGTTQDVADSVVYLCSNMAGHVTGMALPVCGGMQM